MTDITPPVEMMLRAIEHALMLSLLGALAFRYGLVLAAGEDYPLGIA